MLCAPEHGDTQLARHHDHGHWGPALRADTDPGARRALVRAHAAAKVNLALLVGPRREDGYHDLVSVMQSVALWDEVEVSLAPEGFELDVSGGALPADESNLVLVAARELSRRARDRDALAQHGRRGRLRRPLLPGRRHPARHGQR